MIKWVISIGLFFLSFLVNAQTENFKSRSSLGFSVGGSYYIGDLNRYNHFKNTNLSGGILYRYYLNSRLELRGNIMYGHINASDSESDQNLYRNRNLSFQSDIWEFASGIEFSYLNYKLGDMKYAYTPYMFIEMGIARINPKAEYNGSLIELQPLGTEGQGSSLNAKNPYNLTQIVIPFGVGFKFNVNKKMAISIEYSLRKTFSDYLDDVGGNYVNSEQLAVENGNLAAELADRSLDLNRSYGPRGNSTTKDWYSMFGVMMTFSLGEPSTCFYH